MALPASGAISLSDFNTELGNSAGTTISMNDADVRALLGLSAGAEASFSDYYGASSVVDIALTIAANTNNYNIFTNKGGSYVAGKSNVTLTINSGVTVGSTSTGAFALDTGTGWASGDAITIINNGAVRGRGGNGGNGGVVRCNSGGSQGSTTASTAGGTGGDALRAQFATSITNNGTFAGGGGGGGGGGGQWYNSPNAKMGDGYGSKGGGGGGGGAGGSSGGIGATAATHYQLLGGGNQAGSVKAADGSAGTSTAGGSAGLGAINFTASGQPTTAGGAGGGAGSSGSAGLTPAPEPIGTSVTTSGGNAGAAGKYANGNSNVTWTVTGTRQGGVS